MSNIQQEKLYGLASKLNIQCQFCGQTNVVETSLAHKSGASGPMAYDINTKSALASLHTGIGETHLNGILSVMNIPTMTRASFKTREREAGKAVETVAGHTCVETIEIEKENAIKIGETPDENNLVPISCSYDMGWQKRGKGFNSNTGQGAVMGLHTGKIMDYATKTKTCRVCDHAKKMKSTPHKHDCRKNHSGSSKAMEPTSAVQLFNNITKHNAKYSTYTGDDDSTTESFIHAQVPYGVEKFSDIIHIKRSLTSRLHNLSKMKRFPNCSSLSTKVIDYLVKCFSVAVNQNKGDPKLMQASLKCIVPHAFGIHTDCSESWCRWKQEPTMYKHAYLPYGKDLHGEELKQALNDIFSQYHSDTMVEKLAPIANSQRNESFNSTVGSKNPKIRFYGGSESNDFRVACAVAQTNVGYGYICRTLNSLGIEPGNNCEAYVDGMKRKRDDDNTRKKSLKFKKRRNEIHTKRIHGILSSEKKEGKTYETNIGLTLPKATSTCTTANEELFCPDLPVDTLAPYEEIVPPYTPRPQCSPIAFDDNAAVFYNIVLFDTETNTTSKQAELCQLAAINQSRLASFSEYVLPNKNIDKYASRVNNLSIKTVDGKRLLFKQSNPVLALTCDEVLSRFINYLENSVRECQKLTAHKVCTVLVGHNAKRFDVPVILHNSNSSIIAKFQSLGIFFGDSLSLFEYLVKESILKDRNGDSCALNQSAVYKALFDQGFDAHDALEDVKALHRILFSSPLNLSEKDLITHCQAIPFDEAYQDNLYLDQRHQLVQTLDTKLHGTISKSMVQKIASSGLSFANLQSLFDKFGRNGLIGVLSSPPTNNRGSKKPRVTKSKRILLAIVQYFEQTASEH